MRNLWLGARWAGGKLTFLATLLLASVLVLLLPSLVVLKLQTGGFGYVIRGFSIDVAHYWSTVWFHFAHLLHGRLFPPPESLAGLSPFESVPAELANALPITLRLDGVAFAASLVLGLALGLFLSGLAPRWLRAPLWGATSLLYSLPDLLIASGLSLAMLIVAILRGAGPTHGTDSWQHFWAPAVALTLIVAPYIARVTATAVDEITGEQYIRAAFARGVHPAWVLVKHVGKNVLVRISSTLPVVASLLFSSGAVVEYMSEVHGIGRALIISAGPRTMDRYVGVVFLIPLLVLFTLVFALSELIQRRLDPRIGSSSVAAVSSAGRIRLGRPSWAGLIRGLGGVLRAFGAGLVSLPGAIRRAMREPVFVVGALLVLGVVGVAVAAPHLAPIDPTKRVMAITGPGGMVRVAPFPPNAVNWLGTDDMGRDVLSRIIYGTRYALIFAMLAVPARFLLAVPVGLLAAYRGGLWDRLIRWLGVLFTAVPLVLLPLALIPSLNLVFMKEPGVALCWGVLLVALPGAPRLAGSVRQQAAEVLALPMVEGAYAVGAGTTRTLFRYVLPQMGPQLVTMLTLEIPAVLTLTALLGYFRAYPGGAIYDTQSFQPVAPILPEWGSMMETPFMLLMAGRWWLWAPFVALCVAVLAFNLFGEGLRRVLASRTGWKWQG